MEKRKTLVMGVEDRAADDLADDGENPDIMGMINKAEQNAQEAAIVSEQQPEYPGDEIVVSHNNMENPYLLDLFPNTQNQRVNETDQEFDIAPEMAAKMNVKNKPE